MVGPMQRLQPLLPMPRETLPLLSRSSLVAQSVKSLPAMQETQIQPLGQEDPLEKEMTTHSSILAWKIPWTEEPGRLQSLGSQSDMTEWLTLSLSPMSKPLKIPRVRPWEWVKHTKGWKHNVCWQRKGLRTTGCLNILFLTKQEGIPQHRGPQSCPRTFHYAFVLCCLGILLFVI